MIKLLNDFKKFAFKGNVMDLAVAVIIGAAFTAVVNSLVQDIMMPVIGVITAGIDLKKLKWVVRAAEVNDAGTVVKPELALSYGVFIQNLVYFLLVAFSLFLIIRFFNRSLEKVKKIDQNGKLTGAIKSVLPPQAKALVSGLTKNITAAPQNGIPQPAQQTAAAQPKSAVQTPASQAVASQAVALQAAAPQTGAAQTAALQTAVLQTVPQTQTTEQLLTEIRDLLRAQNSAGKKG